MKNVLLVGDAMLDMYVFGEVSRISPEAPIPVLNFQNRTEKAGGASNVARNIAALGLNCHFITCFASDDAGNTLKSLLEIDKVIVYQVECASTITKTRFVSGSNQLLRFDCDEFGEPSNLNQLILEKFSALLDGMDFVIFSDYGKGVLGNVKSLIEHCNEKNVPCFVDPKGDNFVKYSGADFISPNLKELYGFTEPVTSARDGERERVMALKNLGIKNVIVTKSESGATLYGESEILNSSVVAQQVFDVTGAGDVFVSCMVNAMLAGYSMQRSLDISCGLATESVKYSGAYVVNITEFEQAVSTLQSADRKETIVFTNGCFDVVHLGHLKYLKYCRSLGDRVIVGLNSDKSVRMLKGADRPINDENSRKMFLEELPFVDEVILFDDETPLNLITSVMPDVLVKGSDYEGKAIAGADIVLSNGGRVVLSPFVEGYSTTNLVKKVKQI